MLNIIQIYKDYPINLQNNIFIVKFFYKCLNTMKKLSFTNIKRYNNATIFYKYK